MMSNGGIAGVAPQRPALPDLAKWLASDGARAWLTG
jgi:hypothetical protein